MCKQENACYLTDNFMKKNILIFTVFVMLFSCQNNIVEKPKPAEAPSNLAVVGRYILTPRIFDLLTDLPRGAGNEIQLTDAIARLLDHEFVLAHPFEGKRYDCGNKLGYLEATVAYGLKHPETGAAFKEWLKQYSQSL